MTIRARALAALAGLAVLAACAVPVVTPPRGPDPGGALLEATIYLSAAGPDRADARFDFPRHGAAETRITLASSLPAATGARLSCDGPARLVTGALPGLYLRPGAERRFTLPGRHGEVMPRIVLPPETGACRLDWAGHSLALVAEDRADPVNVRRDLRSDTCIRPPDEALDPLARAFFAARPLSLTCARPTGETRLLGDEIEALAIRLERLTGAPISRARLASGDPDMPLDFSRAPRFEQIVVSTLHIRADLSGYLLARALAFHAARGTKVRLMVSNGLMFGKDRRLIEALAYQHPNVQIQYYRWEPEGPIASGGTLLDRYQRSNHVKLFAAIAEEPGHDFAIVGGRNLHDMFFLPELTNRPTRPFLHDYENARGLDNIFAFFSPYEDFEIALLDRAVVGDVISQFGKFWHRDRRGSLSAAQVAGEVVRSDAPREGLVRHFLSLPWADAQTQEALYVDLIDAARSEIVSISPFTYPTPAIDAALARAAGRGVRVRLITREVGGEPPAVFVNGLNTNYFQRRAELFDMRVYTPENRLLHTKIFVVDRRAAIVASTNLNIRSFLHDTENGFVFLDRAVAERLHDMVEETAKKGKREQTPGWWEGLGDFLARTPELRQFF
ncbi:phospholipase D-like domain-containing protein [Sinisalibacter lacisalsi]|uniref:phospholipase D-like domain-containing protein n=1 Tax=Sinisalibacter lacisalsi TaxID=1526570 RepID=UPI001666EA45|nr:phosphatidylserine/phosphatidylglycerophosphate/cardiolipin synthase family protein [Sinisalibacter lacisalsi]